jgi:branched-chain amino acid transport system ATP-binding protein
MTALAPTTPPLLSVRDLSVSYGPIEAVSGVSLDVPEGHIATVIGPNGAGKTTLLSALMGILPSRGAITVDGVETSSPTIARMIAAGIALVPEQRALFATMTVEDNLVLGGFRRHRDPHYDADETLRDVYGRFPRLWERHRQLAGTLSGGERQMLALGRALMGKPRLLMLDEPSLGLAPLVVRDVFQIIAELKRTGVSILLVEQNARAALKVADHAYVLELGRVAMEGPAAELADDPRIVAAYLGKTSRHQEMLTA